jgi:hypothetical protein
MKQAEIVMFAKGSKFDKEKYSIIKLHNEYFGGGMSSIVFQDLRESKALAYSVYSTYTIPKKNDDSHYQFSYIGTQADKLSEAMDGMLGLLTQMPEANSNFNNAKEAVLQKIRTERITKTKVLDYYEAAQKINIDYDQRKDLYDNISDFSMENLREFHNSHVSNDYYTYMVLVNIEDLDMDILKERGYETIDLVIVNLYPFKETIQENCSFEEAIEKIDIGPPTMIRAAAKNFKDVVVVTDPKDYEKVMSEWDNNDGISFESRKRLSQKVFSLMADYNKSIASYLNGDGDSLHPHLGS